MAAYADCIKYSTVKGGGEDAIVSDQGLIDAGERQRNALALKPTKPATLSTARNRKSEAPISPALMTMAYRRPIHRTSMRRPAAIVATMPGR
jgi:hypothetical protein